MGEKMCEMMEYSERKEDKETKWNMKRKNAELKGLTRWNKDEAWMTSLTASPAAMICMLDN